MCAAAVRQQLMVMMGGGLVGWRLQVQVRVVDKRAAFLNNGTLAASAAGPFNISAVLRVSWSCAWLSSRLWWCPAAAVPCA
jgi:hypothetical protein